MGMTLEMLCLPRLATRGRWGRCTFGFTRRFPRLALFFYPKSNSKDGERRKGGRGGSADAACSDIYAADLRGGFDNQPPDAASRETRFRHTSGNSLRTQRRSSIPRYYCHPGHDFLTLLFHEQHRRFRAKARTINLTPVNGINRSDRGAQNEHL